VIMGLYLVYMCLTVDLDKNKTAWCGLYFEFFPFVCLFLFLFFFLKLFFPS
jgi:hypothetical protein